MYWPLGPPKIYVATKRLREPLQARKDLIQEDERDNAIIGFRIGRDGNVLATITATALTIWQTSVGIKSLQLDSF